MSKKRNSLEVVTMKYEYKVEVIKIGRIAFLDDSKKQMKQLNAAGADGWKLVCISEGKKYMKYVYVREAE